MRRRRLPSPPLGTGPDDIELTVRTYNCLRRAKLLQDPEKLGDLTIGQVLSIHGMGAASLVDLLTSLEHLGAAVTGPSDSDVDGRDTEEERLKRIEAGVKHLKALINAEASYIHRRAAGLALKLDLLDAACAGRPIRLGDIQPGLLLDESERSDVTLQDELADIRRRLSEISALEDTQKLVEHLPPAVSALRQVGPVLEELASRVHGLQSGVDALAKTSLEHELTGLVRTALKGRARESSQAIICRRFGFDGLGGCKAQTAAEEFGRSRQLVYTLCQRLARGVGRSTPFAPRLDEALALVQGQVPTHADPTEADLIRAGIAEGSFRLEGISNAALVFNRDPQFSVVSLGEHRFAVPTSATRLPKVVIQVSCRTVARQGMASLEDVASQAAEETGTAATTEFAASVLRSRDDCCSLDKDGAWFWLRAVSRNRIVNHIRKVLSVARTVHVSELRSSVSRHHRMQGFAPPRRALLELCRQLPGVRVESDMVMCEHPPSPRTTMGRTELMLLEILRQEGPVLARRKLETAALKQGVNPSTLSVFLSSSPILSRLAPGVYALVGASVPPGIVESISPRRGRKRVLLDHGWTANGHAWLTYRLSQSMASTGMFYVPRGLAQVLEGEFSLMAPDGASVGQTYVGPKGSWGLASFFRRRGGEAGDAILLVADVDRREMTVHVGDEATLSEIVRSDVG